jgi:hypothetical protein
MASENFEDFRERVQSERSVRAQRDAAERQLPGERLRREIREAFADERSRTQEAGDQAGAQQDPSHPPDDQP